MRACVRGRGWKRFSPERGSMRVGKRRVALSMNYVKNHNQNSPALYPTSLALFNQWHPAELSIWSGKIINRAERKREANISASIVVGTD